MGSELLILEAAAARVLESGDVSEVYRLSTSEIAEQAGLTRGALTHHWPTRGEFEADLLHHLAVGVRARSRQRLGASLESVLTAATKVSFDDIFGVAIESSIDAVAHSDDFPILVGLWAASMTDRHLAEPLAATWEDLDTAFSEQIRLLLAVFRLHMKEGFTPAQLASGLISLVQGYAIRTRIGGDTECFSPQERSRQVRAFLLAYVEPN